MIVQIKTGSCSFWTTKIHEILIIELFFPYISSDFWEIKESVLVVGLENQVLLFFKSYEWSGCNILSYFSASCIGSKVCHFSRCAKCYAAIPICISWSAGNLMTSHSNINIGVMMSSNNLRPGLLTFPSCHYSVNSAGSNIIMIDNPHTLEHQAKSLWE